MIVSPPRHQRTSSRDSLATHSPEAAIATVKWPAHNTDIIDVQDYRCRGLGYSDGSISTHNNHCYWPLVPPPQEAGIAQVLLDAERVVRCAR